MTTVFFMWLVSPVLRFLYSICLVIWALLNLAEMGQQLTRHRHVPGLSALRPLFMTLVLNEIPILRVKNMIEVVISLCSPLLWFPCGLCAPLLPLIGIQLTRLKYVICEFTRQSFSGLDSAMEIMLPEFLYDFVDTCCKPWLRNYVNAPDPNSQPPSAKTTEPESQHEDSKPEPPKPE